MSGDHIRYVLSQFSLINFGTITSVDVDDPFLWSMVVVGEAFLIESFGVQFDSDRDRHGDGCGGKTTEQKVDNIHSQV